MLWLQPPPIVVDVAAQPTPTPDISIEVVLGIFELAGVFLLAAALGSLVVAGAMLLYKRRRDASGGDALSGHTHTRLRI